MSSPNQKKQKSRRTFLNIIFGGSLTAFMSSIVYPVWRFLIPPKSNEPVPTSVLAATIDELKQDSGKIIKFGRKPVILIRIDQVDIRAFSAVCTHLDCIVQYRSDFKHIWCACHNGHYNLNGINISGPPPRPLKPYRVDLKDDKIYISNESFS